MLYISSMNNKKNNKKVMRPNILIETIRRNTYTNTIWKDSIFENLTKESSDTRGKWGEDFLQALIKDVTTLGVEWDGDSNTSNECGSIYDILVKKKRTEAKTAMVGYDKNRQKPTNTWQHENIYKENVWDNLLLLDIKPEGFYITHIEHNDMYFGDEVHPILKKKSTKHLSAWKFDTSKAVLQRGMENGYTIYISVDEITNGTHRGKLKEYFERHFV